MQNRAKWLVAALAMTGIAGAVYAQSATTGDSTSSASTSTAGGHWHHRHGTRGGALLHLLHQLNLTEAQEQSVHSILASARIQFKAQRQAQGTSNFAALANPGDPNHAAALQNLQSQVAARIQARDQVQQQIYAVLTADQKSQLASLLAARQAKLAQHG